jgi:hypothetical protein
MLMSSLPAVAIAFLFALAAPAAVALKVTGDDPCTCLKYKDVYDQGTLRKWKGSCGFTGLELANLKKNPIVSMGAYMDHGKEHCVQFFERLNDNMCLNRNFDTPSESFDPAFITEGEKWCYVSAECTELGNGQKVNENLAFKTCTSPTDKYMENVPPEDLLKLAQKFNVDFSILAKRSYATAPVSWNQTTAEDREAAQQSGVYVLFEHENPGAPEHKEGEKVDHIADLAVILNAGRRQDPPLWIAKGTKLYMISNADEETTEEAKENGRIAERSELTCLEGCV